MTWFPQITQFPFKRTRKWRVISNQLESGELIQIADPDGGQIEWNLSYRDLNDDEAASLSNLFASVQGSFGSFGYIDPLANLFGWSEDLSKADWQTGLLQVSSGAVDPLGTNRASVVANGSAGSQQIIQSLGVPGNYTACFSAWIRSDQPQQVTLARDAVTYNATVDATWRRFFVSGAGVNGVDNASFAVGIDAGQSVQLWGLQAEIQAWPSQYKVTGNAGGIYEETYFASDQLIIISTGTGLSACQVALVSRV